MPRDARIPGVTSTIVDRAMDATVVPGYTRLGYLARRRGFDPLPRMDGRTVLKELKSDAELRSIPVVILTTSKDDEDVYRSYDLGVNSYIVKPVTFEALVDILQTLEKYWFEIVELPQQRE